MIHLGTNYLIGLLVAGSDPAADVDKWLAADLPLAVSAVVWSEFLNGPVTQVEVDRVGAVIQSRVIPFGPAEAVLAAELFNTTGRRRGSIASSRPRPSSRRRNWPRSIYRTSKRSSRTG
jgi:hypothetical protein